MRKPTPLIVGMCILGTLGCSSEPPLPRFSLGFQTPVGPNYRIGIEGRRVKIRDLKAEADSSAITWQHELTDEQIRDLRSALAMVPVEELAWSYRYGWSFSDYNYVFTLPESKGNMHRTLVSGVRRPKLIELAEAVDRIVPEKYRLRYKKDIESLEEMHYSEDAVIEIQEPPNPERQPSITH